ncbi:MAG: hypothetical protein J7K75_07385 [Desulfuromonas sp.]|nr:hypothetical protein [Desulfuromonas sp.]
MNKNNFTITGLDSEIEVDHRCSALLKQFHQQLLQDDIPALDAGQLALGADYFLREFIIGDCRENLLTIDPERVRQFAGHWYIIKTLEPNIKELADILQGVAVFYSYLFDQGWIDEQCQQQIQKNATTLDEYQQRINAFWEISDDGYRHWCEACPLPDNA